MTEQCGKCRTGVLQLHNRTKGREHYICTMCRKQTSYRREKDNTLIELDPSSWLPYGEKESRLAEVAAESLINERLAKKSPPEPENLDPVSVVGGEDPVVTEPDPPSKPRFGRKKSGLRQKGSGRD